MTDTDIATKIGALEEMLSGLIASNAELNETIHERNLLVAAQGRDLAAVKASLPKLITKDEAAEKERKIRRLVAGVLAALVLLIGLGVAFRVQDTQRESDRQAAVERDEEQDRQSLIRGCERGNDARRTLAEVINRAVRPSSAPTATTDPDLLALLEESRQRTLQLRTDLLALPGVQIIDCEAAFPLSSPVAR